MPNANEKELASLLQHEEVVHRVSKLVLAGIGNLFHHQLIELVLKYFFAPSTMKVSWLAHRRTHRRHQLPKKRLPHKISKSFLRSWLIGSSPLHVIQVRADRLVQLRAKRIRIILYAFLLSLLSKQLGRVKARTAGDGAYYVHGTYLGKEASVFNRSSSQRLIRKSAHQTGRSCA